MSYLLLILLFCKSWNMRPRSVPNRCNQVVNFQVWRPDPVVNNQCTLVGENYLDMNDMAGCLLGGENCVLPLWYHLSYLRGFKSVEIYIAT